jgi:hypothetical protein
MTKLPVVAGDWTDTNESDPGITLLELFVFVAELLVVAAVAKWLVALVRPRGRRCRTS